MKGPNEKQHCRDTALRLAGRFEVEIEYRAHQEALDPMELAAWIIQLLSHQGERSNHRVPSMRLEAGSRGAGAPEVEGEQRPLANRPRVRGKGRKKPGKADKDTVAAKKHAAKRYLKSAATMAKQKIYQKRNQERKDGVPEGQLTPLPGQHKKAA